MNTEPKTFWQGVKARPVLALIAAGIFANFAAIIFIPGYAAL